MPRQFVFNWRVSLFAAICLVAFVNLGFWQLSREDEKIQLLADRDARNAATPLEAADVSTEGNVDGIRVQLDGQFEERFWLLDNRVLEGVVGFEVLQRFRDRSGRVFLVNRGFVPMKRTRDELPSVPAPPEQTRVVARIYQPTDEPFVLGEQTAIDAAVPIVQTITSALAAADHDRLYPHLLRLEPQAEGALPRHWPETVMMPSQHRGYAIQWFAMALAVIVVWGFFTWRKDSD